MWLDLGWYVRRLLEKLGMSEWKASVYENKISGWENWMLRKPITNIVITLPDSMIKNEWQQVSASLDNSHVKLVSQTGIWRKTYIWQSMAKVDSQDTKSNNGEGEGHNVL